METLLDLNDDPDNNVLLWIDLVDTPDIPDFVLLGEINPEILDFDSLIS